MDGQSGGAEVTFPRFADSSELQPGHRVGGVMTAAGRWALAGCLSALRIGVTARIG